MGFAPSFRLRAPRLKKPSLLAGSSQMPDVTVVTTVAVFSPGFGSTPLPAQLDEIHRNESILHVALTPMPS